MYKKGNWSIIYVNNFWRAWVRSLWVTLIAGCLTLTGCIPHKPQIKQAVINQDFDDFVAYYDIEIIGTNIKNNLTINGNSVINNTRLNNVVLNGRSFIENSTVKGNLKSNGVVSMSKVAIEGDFVATGTVVAQDVEFKNPIVVNSRQVYLYNVKVPKIYVQNNRNTTIHVYAGTNVETDVVFESGKGRVLIDKLSKVHGSILGEVKEQDMLEIKVGQGRHITNRYPLRY